MENNHECGCRYFIRAGSLAGFERQSRKSLPSARSSSPALGEQQEQALFYISFSAGAREDQENPHPADGNQARPGHLSARP